jgi:hypothetical protein
MNTQATSMPRNADPATPARGWLARIGQALGAAYRQAYVSGHELDARLLADINAPAVPPTPDELRDAYSRWFGGDPTRHL